MAKRIVFFNNRKIEHQAGPIYRIGSDLAAAGKRVILVDANPQCNLTFHSLMRATGSESVITEVITLHSNIEKEVSSAIYPFKGSASGTAKQLNGADCYKLCKRLWLLPGSIAFAEYETSQHIDILPLLIANLLDATAERFEADYILIDTAPSLGRINQTVVMTSDFLVIPLSAGNSVFARRALLSLAEVLAQWVDWSKVYSHSKQSPFPGVKWLGMFPLDKTAISDDVTYAIKTYLAPEFKKYDMIPTLDQRFAINEFMRAAKNQTSKEL